MKAWKVAVVPLLLACDAIPTGPAGAPLAVVPDARATETPPPLLIIAAPGQLAELQRPSGDVERGWVQARLVATDFSDRGGTAQMDGAILVVSAVDGPMPQTSPNATWLTIAINEGTVGSDGVIRFSGVARLRDGTREHPPFDITGSARRTTAGDILGDEIIWDILGSSVHDGVSFETKATVIDRGELLAG